MLVVEKNGNHHSELNLLTLWILTIVFILCITFPMIFTAYHNDLGNLPMHVDTIISHYGNKT